MRTSINSSDALEIHLMGTCSLARPCKKSVTITIPQYHLNQTKHRTPPRNACVSKAIFLFLGGMVVLRPNYYVQWHPRLSVEETRQKKLVREDEFDRIC